MKKLIYLSILVLIVNKLPGQETHANHVDHGIFNSLLKKHVSTDGKVNYRGFIKDITELDNYLNILRKSHPGPGWTLQERMAYWINAYNAFTIKLITDNYPVKSIKDINKDSSPWDFRFILITDRNYSLGEIENQILKKEFNDPRFHFAINCASISCPKLLNEAYQPATLNRQLDYAARDFINDETRNRITPGSAQLSSVFEWYNEDFTKEGTLIGYINRFAETKIGSNAKVKYLPYNWNLNE